MGTVLLDLAISLDGFITGPNGDDAGLFDWYFAPASPSKAVIDELVTGIGAMIMGRTSYLTGAEGGFEGDPYTPWRYVLTHHPPETPYQGTKSFIFVTDGIESALKQAQTAAGDKIVAIGGGADVAQQYLRAGLVDEIQLHVVSKLIGTGLRLFDNLGSQTIPLERTRVIESSGVTHIRYNVLKNVI